MQIRTRGGVADFCLNRDKTFYQQVTETRTRYYKSSQLLTQFNFILLSKLLSCLERHERYTSTQ